MKKILLLEDDKGLNEGISIALEGYNNYRVESAFFIKEARNLLEEESFDLLILDINLPDGSGLDFLREIRPTYKEPIILLTARDMETDEVLGFSLGANDYVTKPFSLSILKARVDNQLKDRKNHPSYKEGALSLDFERMIFKRGEQDLLLSKQEYRLLYYFLSNRGRVLRREQIQDYVWNEPGGFINENTLSVTINRLRNKLGKEEYIKTIYGLGYKWEGGQ